MPEIRWILLGLGAVLIAGIWWWGARRSAQAPAGGELRRSEIAPAPPLPVLPLAARQPATEWAVSPLEPLSIRTADFDDVPVLDLPLRTEPSPEAPLPVAPLPVAPKPRTSFTETQKIVTLRVTAPGGVRWSGRQLRAALEQEGLEHGRYQVFHRRHTDGRTLFCVASLIEPGTFDLATMPAQEFRGITAFAVLPGPTDPLQTFDALVDCVRGLAESLSGTAQDPDGSPLSPPRAAALRDEVRRFHAQRS